MIKVDFYNVERLSVRFNAECTLIEEKGISITVLPYGCDFRLIEQVDLNFDGLVVIVSDQMFREIKKDKANNKLKDIFQYYEKYTSNKLVENRLYTLDERCYYYHFWRKLAFYLNAPQEVKDRIIVDTINSTIRRKRDYCDSFIARKGDLILWLFQEGDDKESIRKAVPKCTRVFFVDSKRLNSLYKIICRDMLNIAYSYIFPEEREGFLPYLTTDFLLNNVMQGI